MVEYRSPMQVFELNTKKQNSKNKFSYFKILFSDILNLEYSNT